MGDIVELLRPYRVDLTGPAAPGGPRLCVVVGGQPDRRRHAAEQLAASLGARYPGPSGLIPQARELLGAHLVSPDNGVASLTGPTRFGMLTRRLLDRMYGEPTAGWVIDDVEHGREVLPLIATLYPDAVVVVVGATGAERRGVRGVAAALADRWSLRRAIASVPDLEIVRERLGHRGGIADVVGLPGRSNAVRTFSLEGDQEGSGPDFELCLIVGSPRSGTTWLHSLINAHPVVGGPVEIETNLFRACRNFHLNAAGPQVGRVDEAARYQALREFCDAMLGPHLGRGETIFAEKTPSHALFLDQIQGIYPGVKVVHIVRDPRDVIRSGLEMEHSTLDADTAARRWTNWSRRLRADAERLGSVVTVRYEDVLADPRSAMTEIFGCLGVEVDPEVLHRVGGVVGRRVSQFNTTGPVGAGKWSQLPGDLIDRIVAVTGDEMAHYGYAEPAEVMAARSRVSRSVTPTGEP